jgi:hypothetical protein
MVEKNVSSRKSSSYPRRYLITAAQASYRLKWDKEKKEYIPVATGPIATLH